MKAHSVLTSFVVVCSFPFFAGCMVDAPAVPEQPAMAEIEASSAAPEQLAPGIAEGRPTRLYPGTGMSYWVWSTQGNAWHLRATTARQPHRFQGRIRALNGATLEGLKATRPEWSDRVRAASGTEAVFDFTAHGGEDGLDFNVSGSGCLQMDLRIDGTPRPTLTMLGKTGQIPQSGHFIVCG